MAPKELTIQIAQLREMLVTKERELLARISKIKTAPPAVTTAAAKDQLQKVLTTTQELQQQQQQLQQKIADLARQLAGYGESQQQIARQQLVPLTTQCADLQKQLQQGLTVRAELTKKIADLSKQMATIQQPQNNAVVAKLQSELTRIDSVSRQQNQSLDQLKQALADLVKKEQWQQYRQELDARLKKLAKKSGGTLANGSVTFDHLNSNLQKALIKMVTGQIPDVKLAFGKSEIECDGKGRFVNKIIVFNEAFNEPPVVLAAMPAHPQFFLTIKRTAEKTCEIEIKSRSRIEKGFYFLSWVAIGRK